MVNRNRLISRRTPSDLSGTWDKIKEGFKSAAKGALDYYGQTQRELGAQQAAASQQTQVASASGGITTTHLMMAGGAALLLVVLLRRKS